FADNLEPADVARPSHMRSAAQFHRISVEAFGVTADLHYSDNVSIFFAKELLNVRTLPGFGIRDLRPRILGVLYNFFIHQFLDIALLVGCEGRARKIES